MLNFHAAGVLRKTRVLHHTALGMTAPPPNQAHGRLSDGDQNFFSVSESDVRDGGLLAMAADVEGVAQRDPRRRDRCRLLGMAQALDPLLPHRAVAGAPAVQRPGIGPKPPAGTSGRCDDSAVEVRQATSGDTQAIAEISVRSWQVGYAGQVPQAYLDGLDVSRRGQAIQAMLARSSGPSPGFFVAENASGRLLGFANVRPSEENLGSGEGELQTLYVHPDDWRHGVGSELMRACLHLLRSEGKVEAVLWVLDRNDRARRFYENRGWVLDEATRPIVIAEQRLVEVRYRRTLAHWSVLAAGWQESRRGGSGPKPPA